MELQLRRRQLALAQQGQDLLEEKRLALLRELMKMADIALLQGTELDRAAAAAHEALHLSKALDGPEAVRSAAFAADAELSPFEVAIDGAMIFGVAVPVLSTKEQRRGILERGYSLTASSARIDDVAARFEEEVNCLVRLAETDARMRRVGEEIQRTSRRVNALRQVLIPDLERDIERIAAVLREQEREDAFRLKHLKRLRSVRRESGAGGTSPR
jgi:V/A-type H+-transporting ATPase subunit D